MSTPQCGAPRLKFPTGIHRTLCLILPVPHAEIKIKAPKISFKVIIMQHKILMDWQYLRLSSNPAGLLKLV